MAVGYAGLYNPLFYMNKMMVICGDAMKVVADSVKGLEQSTLAPVLFGCKLLK